MLTKPDFLQKQIFIIFSGELRGVRFMNENIVIEEDGKIINQGSLHKIFAVFLIGEATITTSLIRKLKAFGISLILLRKNFELIDWVESNLNHEL